MSGPLQWSPGGMVAIGASDAATAGIDVRAFDEGAPDADAVAVSRSAPATTRAVPKAKPIAPRDVLRLARARLREVEAELKRIRRLEAERDELKRLLDAASNKPRAVVRELPKRSAG